MSKAILKLPDGTSVVIEGSPAGVAKTLALYGGAPSGTNAAHEDSKKESKRKPEASKNKVTASTKVESEDSPDLQTIINHIKECDQAESIENNVLDKTGQVNRILLPLFIVHEYMGNVYGLTSGEVSTITRELGITIQQGNASKNLSGSASKYVGGNKVRKPGRPVRYKINRRGVRYFKGVLNEESDGK